MWFLCTAVLCLSVTYVGAQLGGPYDLIVHKFEECKETGSHEVVINIKTKRINKNTLHMTGNFSAPYGITDKMVARMSVGADPSESGLVWEKTTRIVTRDLGGTCSAFRTYAPQTGKQVFKLLGYPPHQCPRKGNYEFDGNLEITLAGIPVMVYGKFRLDFLLYSANNSKKIGCLFAIAEFTPKIGGRKRKGK